MADDKPTETPSPSGTGAFLGKLLDQNERADEREAQDRKEERASLQANADKWFRLSLALVVVLLVLVSGIVGVGVTGEIPGVGTLHVDKAEAATP